MQNQTLFNGGEGGVGGGKNLFLSAVVLCYDQHAAERVSGVCQDAYFLSQLSTRRPGIHGTRNPDSGSGNESGTTRENPSL